MTVAFIGLGMMGAPMAASLSRNGFKPRLFDANPGAITSFLESNHGVVCSSAAHAASGADMVITMLPDGKVVRDAVLSEPGGAAMGLNPGGIVVDMSSSSPVDTEELGKALATRGLGLIDAPVSGGVKRAIEGKLAIMAGGDPALVERCRPAFEAMGASLTLTGRLGSGHAWKALAMNTPLLSSEKDFCAAAEKSFGFRADHTLVYKYVEQQQS